MTPRLSFAHGHEAAERPQSFKWLERPGSRGVDLELDDIVAARRAVAGGGANLTWGPKVHRPGSFPARSSKEPLLETSVSL